MISIENTPYKHLGVIEIDVWDKDPNIHSDAKIIREVREQNDLSAGLKNMVKGDAMYKMLFNTMDLGESNSAYIDCVMSDTETEDFNYYGDIVAPFVVSSQYPYNSVPPTMLRAQAYDELLAGEKVKFANSTGGTGTLVSIKDDEGKGTWGSYTIVNFSTDITPLNATHVLRRKITNINTVISIGSGTVASRTQKMHLSYHELEEPIELMNTNYMSFRYSIVALNRISAKDFTFSLDTPDGPVKAYAFCGVGSAPENEQGYPTEQQRLNNYLIGGDPVNSTNTKLYNGSRNPMRMLDGFTGACANPSLRLAILNALPNIVYYDKITNTTKTKTIQEFWDECVAPRYSAKTLHEEVSAISASASFGSLYQTTIGMGGRFCSEDGGEQIPATITLPATASYVGNMQLASVVINRVESNTNSSWSDIAIGLNYFIIFEKPLHKTALNELAVTFTFTKQPYTLTSQAIPIPDNPGDFAWDKFVKPIKDLLDA